MKQEYLTISFTILGSFLSMMTQLHLRSPHWQWFQQFAAQLQLAQRFYAWNLLEIKGFNCLAIVLLISFETPSFIAGGGAASRLLYLFYIYCLPFSGGAWALALLNFDIDIVLVPITYFCYLYNANISIITSQYRNQNSTPLLLANCWLPGKLHELILIIYLANILSDVTLIGHNC